MAKTTKRQAKNSVRDKSEDVIEDAVVLTDADKISETDVTAESAENEVDRIVDDVIADDSAINEAISQTASSSEPDAHDNTDQLLAKDTPEPAYAPATPNPIIQKVGFGQLVGGGLVAGGLGFLAAWWGLGQNGEDLTPQFTEQAAKIEELQTQLAAIPPAPAEIEVPDIAPLQGSIDTLQTEVAEQFTAIGSSLSEHEERLNAVERAPSEDGGISETAITSIEREMEGLREEVAAQELRIQQIADAAAADLAAAQAQTIAIEQQAQAQAQAAAEQAMQAQATAAAAQIQIALDAGEPFEPALADLEAAGVSVPEELKSIATDGVITIAELQEGFPDAARSALAIARSEGAEDSDAGGLTSFFRRQFDVRSVEPREGDDPDAVLSRAEAALRNNQADVALEEISTLPETVQAVFDDWRSAAQTRVEALAAISALQTSTEN